MFGSFIIVFPDGEVYSSSDQSHFDLAVKMADKGMCTIINDLRGEPRRYWKGKWKVAEKI